MIRSLWQDNINVEIEEPLDNNIETDILIVGGGISGISTAFYLKDSNFKVTLVDRDRVGFGVSSLSTAKLTFNAYLTGNLIGNSFNTTYFRYYPYRNSTAGSIGIKTFSR